MASTLRYQPVDPERLEIEPEIYHNDDTVHIFGDQSTSTAVGLRELLSLERLNRPQRAACYGAVGVLSLTLLLTLVFVLAGWRRVQSDMQDRAITARSGLQMVPDLLDDGVMVMRISRSRPDDSPASDYVKDIDKYLDKYIEEQRSRAKYTVDCDGNTKPDNKWCRFSTTKNFVRSGTTGCTSENKYGYGTRKPCVLLVFRDSIGWEPKMLSKNASQIAFRCSTKDPYMYDGGNQPTITYYPVHSLNADYGAFPINKIPSRKINETNGSEISDDSGETLYDLPGLAFVQFTIPDLFMHGKVYCTLSDTLKGAEFSNAKSFNGLRELRFDIMITP